MHTNLRNKPLVTVAIATYNRPASTLRAIASVQDQTYSNWELFVVDDCSTDDTETLVRKYIENDPRINYVRLEKNQGQSAARNIAAERGSGEYVAFLDSDDEWLPTKLEKQIEVFLEAGSKVGLAYTGAYFVSEDHSVSRTKHAKEQGDLYHAELAYNPIGAPSRVMVRRSCFDAVGGFDTNFRSHEDWELWIRITEHNLAACIPEPLVQYVESNDSMSINPDKLIAGYELLWKKHGILERGRVLRAVHFLRLGHRLCYYGATERGREYLRRALVAAPWQLKTIAVFLLSLLPHRTYQSITFFLMKHAG